MKSNITIYVFVGKNPILEKKYNDMLIIVNICELSLYHTVEKGIFCASLINTTLRMELFTF